MAGPEKSEGAFRTIREVADWLGVPTHVLRFWESKFDQIAPVKGAGGRRYYRPEDMRLLGGIKVMLHDQGLPIRGVGQKIDEGGVDAVMLLSPDLDMPDTAAALKARRVIRPGEDGETGTVVPFGQKPARQVEPPAPVDPGPRDVAATLVTEPDEPMPSQPGVEATSGQLGEEVETPQPADLPVEEPLDTATQPDAPATDPEAPEPEPEETPEPADQPKDDLSVAASGGPQAPAIRPGQTRRLRRVVRKLRGLIEELEADAKADAGSLHTDAGAP